MAESTNQPTGPGSNPGRPPLNDQGAAMPNPAPPPPASLPPQKTGIENVAEQMAKMGKETEEALKALEEFKKKQEELNKIIQDQAAALEKKKTLDSQVADALLAEKKAKADAVFATEDLNKEFKEYKDGLGNWLENTEPLQELYKNRLQEISETVYSAADALDDARAAARLHEETMVNEAAQREKAINELKVMEDLHDDIVDVDASFKDELSPTIDGLKKGLSDAQSQLDEYQKAQAESTDFLKSLKDVSKKINDETLKRAADDAKKRLAEMQAVTKEERDLKRKQIQLMREEQTKTQDAEALKGLESSGGLAGAGDIRKYLEEMVDAQKEMIKKSDPNISQKNLDRLANKMIASNMTVLAIEKKIQDKFNSERTEAERKVVDSIMSEKKVSEAMAVAMMRSQSKQKDTEIYKSLQEINKKQQEQVLSLKTMTVGQRQALARADQDAADRLETASEMKNLDPSKATLKMGERIAMSIHSLKEGLSGIFKKDDGWLKTIALVLTMVIGATIGYIWLKIKTITGLLTMLPGKLGGFFKGIFSGIGGGAKGIFSAISGPFKALKGFLEPILKLFPGISSSLGQFGKAFSFGFRILGKVFFWVGLTVDVLMGAYKGFKQLGNIKGLLMGVVAGIISFFTFGLIDFQTIFDTLGSVFGKFFDALSGVFEAFKWVYEPLWKAFKNIIAIFQGEGSLVSKIFKAIWEGIKGWYTFLFRQLLNLAIRLPMLILKMVYGLFEGIVVGIYKLLKWWYGMLFDAGMWLFEWFTSGRWLDDVLKVGTWLYDEIVSFFGGLMDSVADALGEIPFIGGAIKGYLGGGSDKENELKTTVEKASETTEKMVTESKATKEVLLDVPKEVAAHPLAGQTAQPIAFAPERAVSIPVSTPAGAQVAQASAQASAAQIAAGKSEGQTTAISAPTTNVVGGGGDSAVIMPSISRNNDPTFRALLFLESPAM